MTPTILQEVVQAVRGLTEEQQKEVLAYARKMREEKSEENVSETEAKPKKRKLLERLEQIMKELPPEAFEGYPTDGSLNHDHYLYGAPKREQK